MNRSNKSKQQIYKESFRLFTKVDVPNELLVNYMDDKDGEATLELQCWLSNNMKTKISDWSTAIGIIDSVEHMYKTALENGNIEDEHISIIVDNNPTEDEIIDTIINCVYIRGIDLEGYRNEFTNERSGLINALNKLYDSKREQQKRQELINIFSWVSCIGEQFFKGSLEDIVDSYEKHIKENLV